MIRMIGPMPMPLRLCSSRIRRYESPLVEDGRVPIIWLRLMMVRLGGT